MMKYFTRVRIPNAAVSGRSASSTSARTAVLRGYAFLRLPGIILKMAKLL